MHYTDRPMLSPFDVVEIHDKRGILKINGGDDHDGLWHVITSYDDFVVLNRGPRIARVLWDCIKMVKTDQSNQPTAENNSNG